MEQIFSEAEVILGVDTHLDVHVGVVIDQVGPVQGTHSIPTNALGYEELLGWVQQFGDLKRAGIEGTASYGAGLTRFLQAKGITVIEVNRPNRMRRRSRGKSDPTDAESAARAVLAEDANSVPKAQSGLAEALRMLNVARRSAVKGKTQAVNQLRALLVSAPQSIREAALKEKPEQCIAACMELDQHLSRLAKMAAPRLLERFGVGPQTAATLLITAGDNPTRLRNEAALAALCGVSPLQASSGKTSRHRLNRGGDRQANNALCTIALVRMRGDARTREYVARRTGEGLSKKEFSGASSTTLFVSCTH